MNGDHIPTTTSSNQERQELRSTVVLQVGHTIQSTTSITVPRCLLIDNLLKIAKNATEAVPEPSTTPAFKLPLTATFIDLTFDKPQDETEPIDLTKDDDGTDDNACSNAKNETHNNASDNVHHITKNENDKNADDNTNAKPDFVLLGFLHTKGAWEVYISFLDTTDVPTAPANFSHLFDYVRGVFLALTYGDQKSAEEMRNGLLAGIKRCLKNDETQELPSWETLHQIVDFIHTQRPHDPIIYQLLVCWALFKCESGSMQDREEREELHDIQCKTRPTNSSIQWGYVVFLVYYTRNVELVVLFDKQWQKIHRVEETVFVQRRKRKEERKRLEMDKRTTKQTNGRQRREIDEDEKEEMNGRKRQRIGDRPVSADKI